MTTTNKSNFVSREVKQSTSPIMPAIDQKGDGENEMAVVMPLFRSLNLISQNEPCLRLNHTQQQVNSKVKSRTFVTEQRAGSATKVPQDQNQLQLNTTQLQYGWNVEKLKLRKISPFHQISNDSVIRIPKESTSLQIVFDTIYDVLHHYSIQATFLNTPSVMAQCQAIPSICIDKINLPLEFNIYIWDDTSSYLIELNYVSGDTIAFRALCQSDIMMMLTNRLVPSLRIKQRSSIFDARCSMDVDEAGDTMEQFEAMQSLVAQAIKSATGSPDALDRKDYDWWMTPHMPEISSTLDVIEQFFNESSSSLHEQSKDAYRRPRYDLQTGVFNMLIQMTDPNQSGYELAHTTSQSIFLNTEVKQSQMYPNIRKAIVSTMWKDEECDNQHVIAAMTIVVQCLALWNSREIVLFLSSLSPLCINDHREPYLFDVVDRLMQRWILTTPCLSTNATIATLMLQILSIIMNQHLDIQRYINDRYCYLIQQVHEYGSIHHIRLQHITSQMLSQCNMVHVI